MRRNAAALFAPHAMLLHVVDGACIAQRSGKAKLRLSCALPELEAGGWRMPEEVAQTSYTLGWHADDVPVRPKPTGNIGRARLAGDVDWPDNAAAW